MTQTTKAIMLGTVASALALSGCGGGGGSPLATSPTTAAITAAAQDMSPPDDRTEPERVSDFETLLTQLRAVPQLAPLFDLFHVPSPVEFDDDDAGDLVGLLRAVRISVGNGAVTITNRETGGVIFTAPLSDLASGVFHPENLPGASGAPPPPVTTCTSFAYSAWGPCQPNNTQTRTVLSSSPAGCTGGNPVLSQTCVYTPPPPPPPAPTCTSFTYSAWGPCQSNNTQTRTVLSSSPAGCTGGNPVLSQSCVYTPPLDGAALYAQYCSGCHGPLASSSLKGRAISLSLIKQFNMTQGLSDAQLQAIVTAVGP